MCDATGTAATVICWLVRPGHILESDEVESGAWCCWSRAAGRRTAGGSSRHIVLDLTGPGRPWTGHGRCNGLKHTGGRPRRRFDSMRLWQLKE